MNRRILLISLLLALLSGKAISQVRDITFTVSPVVEHIWWNNDLSLENSTWMGLKAGFGFGPLFELRGFYQRVGNVENKMLMPEGVMITEPLFITGESDITRYGGEMKVNLSQGGLLAPYITLGGGVQAMDHLLPLSEEDSDSPTLKEEQLFGVLGIGTKFHLSDRMVLSLEARNSFFGMNNNSPLLSNSYSVEESGRLHNWSAAASLDFYLGGSNPDEGSVAEAYRKLLADGFHGMKFVLEPGGTYINFHDESPLHNHYLLGVSAGVDFTSLVGIRGFYYKSTEEVDKLSLSMGDHLTIYGANLIARLNQPRGVNPYLQLGAGRMDVAEDYVARDGFGMPESRNFAFGGAGLEIPLSRYVALYGSASAMLTSESGVETTEMINPSQVKTSMLYNAGVRLNLGRSAEYGADALFSSQLDKAMADERVARNKEINSMRAEYESRLAALDDQRALAEAQGDTVRARALLAEQSRTVQEKNRMEQTLTVMDNEEQIPYDSMTGDRVLRMSSNDLAQLVDRVVDEVRRDTRYIPYYGMQPTADGRQQFQPIQETSRQDELRSEEMARLEQQNNELTRRLDELTIRLDEASRRGTSSSETIVITDRGGSTAAPAVSPMTGYTGGKSAARDNRTFKWNRLSLYTGPGFGDLSAWHLGVRGHMQISNTSLDFMPEFYAAMGSKSGVGISGNIVWNIENFSTRFTPYLGLGLGIFHGEKVHSGTNIIIGTTLNLGSGAFFTDYSIRNYFKQNQLAVGYRFVF
jgi:hypothetical protein